MENAGECERLHGLSLVACSISGQALASLSLPEIRKHFRVQKEMKDCPGVSIFLILLLLLLQLLLQLLLLLHLLLLLLLQLLLQPQLLLQLLLLLLLQLLLLHCDISVCHDCSAVGGAICNAMLTAQ